MNELELAKLAEEVVEILEETDQETLTENENDKPQVEIHVERVDTTCTYKFTFKVTKRKDNVTNGNIKFTLAGAFTNTVQVLGGDGTFTPAAPAIFNTWTYGPLTTVGQTKTASFTALYTGPTVNNLIVLSNIGSFDGSQKLNDLPDVKKDVVQCPPTPPCCEKCDATKEVTIDACEDFKEVTVDPDIKSKGRVLAVNVNLPRACKNKDINVGIFVTEEVDGDKPGIKKEIPVAFKIIRRKATDPAVKACDDNRDCGCVNFLIDDDDTTKCLARKFIIKTEAHYVARPGDTNQKCSCNCPV